jgi:hypothetical protein
VDWHSCCCSRHHSPAHAFSMMAVKKNRVRSYYSTNCSKQLSGKPTAHLPRTEWRHPTGDSRPTKEPKGTPFRVATRDSADLHGASTNDILVWFSWSIQAERDKKERRNNLDGSSLDTHCDQLPHGHGCDNKYSLGDVSAFDHFAWVLSRP